MIIALRQCFRYFVHVKIVGNDNYKVEVRTTQLNNVFEVGSTAQFQCSITPPPSVSKSTVLRYYWTIPLSYSRVLLTSNISIYIDIYRYTVVNSVYCEVTTDTALRFGVGYLKFEVKGNLIHFIY